MYLLTFVDKGISPIGDILFKEDSFFKELESYAYVDDILERVLKSLDDPESIYYYSVGEFIGNPSINDENEFKLWLKLTAPFPVKNLNIYYYDNITMDNLIKLQSSKMIKQKMNYIILNFQSIANHIDDIIDHLDSGSIKDDLIFIKERFNNSIESTKSFKSLLKKEPSLLSSFDTDLLLLPTKVIKLD